MSKERPPDWHPPRKDHGGENIPEYFALLLLDAVMGTTIRNTRNFTLPILAGADGISAELDNIRERLIQQQAYFYDTAGNSIYRDYKIMRDEACRKIGRGLDIEDPENALNWGYTKLMSMFDFQMSTTEALELARSIVASGGWE